MAKDHELDWLLTQLEAIPHIKRLRIHSRLPIVIPARITDALVERFFSFYAANLAGESHQPCQ